MTAPSRLAEFLTKLLSPSIWSLGCLTGCAWLWCGLEHGGRGGTGRRCSPRCSGSPSRWWRCARALPMKPLLRALSILPIITPPFVIGLALILLFGRAGMVTVWIGNLLDIPRSRWIYGMPGITIAQVLAFTPISLLVLLGVLQGVAPSLEEASQTLRASRWYTFRTVTWPLIRPGPRQRLPDRLHREHGGLRQPAGDRRQLQRAVHRYLLRRGRRLARPGPCGGARHRAAGIHAGRLPGPALLARPRAATRPSPARATPAFPPRCRPACASPATR